MLLLYAVTRPDPPETHGLSVAPGREVAVLYDEVAEPPSYERSDVERFAGVLLGLGASLDLLPVRYGTALPDRDALRDLLASEQERWTELLDRLAGHVETLVHWQSTEPGPPAGGTGRAYLLERVARERHRRAVLTSLVDGLGHLVSESRPLNDERLACLVPRHALDSFGAALSHIAAERAERLWWSGPWPPFSFIDPEEAA